MKKVIAFLVGLAVVFGVALWVGTAVGPSAEEAPEQAGAPPAAGGDAPGGLQSTQGGYTLELADSIAPAQAAALLDFRILDASGAPVKEFDVVHDKQLHLIVVRNDLARFQHVHPTLGEDGTWRVPLNLQDAGDYRVYADFTPTGGPALTLAANLHVGGTYRPQPLPTPSTTAEVDGYTVTLSGEPKANDSSMLTLTVSQNGNEVNDLQPYLAAYGHLVAIRASDLAYLHVHPSGEPGDGVTPSGPEIKFHTSFPSAGAYRLFFDFQHRDVVRTAAFTVRVGDSAAPQPATGGHSGHGGH